MAVIDGHRSRFGVEPMGGVLVEHGVAIAHQHLLRGEDPPPSARSIADAELLVEIRRVQSSPKIGRGLYGARKVWHQLRRKAR